MNDETGTPAAPTNDALSTLGIPSPEETSLADHLDTRRHFIAKVAAGLGASSLVGGAAAVTAATALAAPQRNKYYFMAENLHDPFYVPGIAGMNAAAKLHGFSAQIIGPQDLNFASAFTTLQTLLAKPDTAGVLSYFTDYHVGKPLYEQAFKQHIPIVNGAGDWGGPRLCVSAFDYMVVPRNAVTELGKALGGTGSVGTIFIANAQTIQENKNFQTLLKQQFPHISFAGFVNYDGSSANGLAQYSAFVGAHPDVTGMFWLDGAGASFVDGIYAAKPSIKLMIRSLSTPAYQAVQNGKAIGTTDGSRYAEEFWGFSALYYAVNGDYLAPDSVNNPAPLVTKANVKSFLKNPYLDQIKWA